MRNPGAGQVPKPQRLQEFFRRLGELPLAQTREEAKAQVDAALNEVEDELSCAPYDPPAWRTDGRMYPAQEDRASYVPGQPGVVSYSSRGHKTLIRDNGALEIQDMKTGKVVFRKQGADGKGVWQ